MHPSFASILYSVPRLEMAFPGPLSCSTRYTFGKRDRHSTRLLALNALVFADHLRGLSGIP